MFRTMLKSKIYYAVITDTQLYYKGSITVDEVLLKEADIAEGEQVDVLNLNNGSRLQTYVIKGKAGSGRICLNGPSARRGYKGDRLIIISYALYEDAESITHRAKFVELNAENKINNTFLGG